MESGFLRAGAVRLEYFSRGRGPEAIVFVHGYQASARVWRLVQEALDPERYRTIALNNRGAGDSDRTEREDDYRIESFATDLGAARILHRKLQPWMAAAFVEPNPIPAKAALAMMGMIENVLRLPLVPLSDASVSVVKAALVAAGDEDG